MRSIVPVAQSLRSALALLVVGACFAGCESGDRVSPIAPSSSEFVHLWPNDEGNTWVFEFTDSETMSPNAPALDGLMIDDPEEADFRDLETRLWLPFPEDSSAGAERLLSLSFAGSIRTPAGVKQRLRGEFRVGDERKTGSTKTAEALVIFSLFTGDHAFERKKDWIGYYPQGESADSSYTIAKTPLEEGASFRHQLASGFSEHSWEYGWVLGERTIETPAGVFENAIGFVYIIDLGVTMVFGELNGLYHFYSLSVFYLAPEFGPLYLREISVLDPVDPDEEFRASFRELKLREYALVED